MWMFNPGNPTRGATKMAEEDVYPEFIINKQITMPPFFRCDIPGGGLLETYYPSAAGRKYMKRYYPNGKLVYDLSEGPNTFSYLGFGTGESTQLFGAYFGGPLYPPSFSVNTYVYEIEIDGDVVFSEPTLSLDQLWEVLYDTAGVAPVQSNARYRTVYDYDYAVGGEPIAHGLLVGFVIFALPAETNITIRSSVIVQQRSEPYIEVIEDTKKVVEENSDNGAKGWHVEWMGGVIGAMQKPFLMFHQWIIGDLASVPPAWEGPISFDVLSPFDLDLYEIVWNTSSNPYSSGSVTRGEFLGKTTVYPAWS